jgi:hypothetical protein
MLTVAAPCLDAPITMAGDDDRRIDERGSLP